GWGGMSGRDDLVMAQAGLAAWQPPPERQWLAGHVIRPPVLAWHAGALCSARLIDCDDAAARAVPRAAAALRRGAFLGRAPELAALLGIGEDRITLICWQAPSSGEDPLYAHHAAADAALLAHSAGRAVRVRVEAHELGATQAVVNTHIESAWTRDGEIAAYAV